MKKVLALMVACILLTSLAALGLAAEASKKGGKKTKAATHTVKMKDNFFDKKKITIQVGDTVTWDNKGMSTHTATSDDPNNKFDTDDIAPGDPPKSHTFTKAGTVEYYCKHHKEDGMIGTIVVEEDKK